MHRIIEGIKRFQRQVFQNHQAHFEKLASGQSPEVLFITCSDSRIDPALLTQTLPGELFILRNAGNLVPAYGTANGGEGATIEYAVTGLGVKDIVVCGHTHCGAMNALLHPEHLEALPAVAAWLAHAEPTRHLLTQDPGEDPLLTAAERNTLLQLENLKTHPSVAAKLAIGELNLHAWVYHFENGKVMHFDKAANRFVEIDPTF